MQVQQLRKQTAARIRTVSWMPTTKPQECALNAPSSPCDNAPPGGPAAITPTPEAPDTPSGHDLVHATTATGSPVIHTPAESGACRRARGVCARAAARAGACVLVGVLSFIVRGCPGEAALEKLPGYIPNVPSPQNSPPAGRARVPTVFSPVEPGAGAASGARAPASDIDLSKEPPSLGPGATPPYGVGAPAAQAGGVATGVRIAHAVGSTVKVGGRGWRAGGVGGGARRGAFGRALWFCFQGGSNQVV